MKPNKHARCGGSLVKTRLKSILDRVLWVGHHVITCNRCGTVVKHLYIRGS